MSRRRGGQVLILVTIGIVFFMALLALVLETGRVYHARVQLFDFCDAAALAGAHDLPASSIAKQTAIEYYAKNIGASTDEIEVIDEEGNITLYRVRKDTVRIATPYEDDTTKKQNIPPEYAIEVRACRSVPLFFAGLLGLKEANPCGRAVAGRPEDEDKVRLIGAHLDLEAEDDMLLAYASPGPQPSSLYAIFVTGTCSTLRGLLYTLHRAHIPGARKAYIEGIIANIVNPIGAGNLFRPGPYSPFAIPALLE